MRKIAESFTEQLKLKLGADLKSVFLYGSVARGEYTKKHSDINMLIIVEDMDIAVIHKISAIKKKSAYKNIEPLIFTKDYLENSADVFPIEFLDIKESHVLLAGEDFLKDLKISQANLRRQCEWELKSKLLQLEKIYINSQANEKLLRQFLLKELPSFLVVFKNVLRLKGIAAGFDLDSEVLNKLQQARLGNTKIDDVYTAFEKIFSQLKRLSDVIDKLPVKYDV